LSGLGTQRFKHASNVGAAVRLQTLNRGRRNALMSRIGVRGQICKRETLLLRIMRDDVAFHVGCDRACRFLYRALLTRICNDSSASGD
jgi:hypothetical protein